MSFLNKKYQHIKDETVPYMTGFGAKSGFISKAAFLRAYAIYKEISGSYKREKLESEGFYDTELDDLYPEWRNHIIK